MGMVWYDRAARAAGFAAPSWFAEHIDEDKRFAYIWRRFRSGERSPNTALSRSRIDEVEELVPGSSSVFSLPFWRVLKGEQLSLEEIVDSIDALGDPTRTILLAGGYERIGFPGEYPRYYEEVLSQLKEFPTFETLQAITLLRAWADALRSPDLWNSTCDFYRYMIPHFIIRAHVPCHEDLFDVVDDFARTREYPKANLCKRRYKSWRRECRRLKRMQRKLLDAEKAAHRLFIYAAQRDNRRRILT
jgi:hypothetical protein